MCKLLRSPGVVWTCFTSPDPGHYEHSPEKQFWWLYFFLTVLLMYSVIVSFIVGYIYFHMYRTKKGAGDTEESRLVSFGAVDSY